MEAIEEPMELTENHLFLKGRRSKRERLHPYTASREEEPTATATYNQEEEDMANCLILLAQGRSRRPPLGYHCRTCGRCFPTFQALGGHRTSHKKTGKPESGGYEERFVKTKNGGRKAHECSVCGAVFGSGQALGGHMRRHRMAGGDGVSCCRGVKRGEERMLILDLNKPAPEEDRQKESKVVVEEEEEENEGDRLELSFSSILGFCHY